VLTDNATLTDRYFTGEPGLSLYIETGSRRILFDTGYSGAFIGNAYKMGIDLLQLDYVILSHGHIDHTGGLPALIQLFLEAKIEKHLHKTLKIVAHPHCFYSRSLGRLANIGSQVSYENLALHFTVETSKAPVWPAAGLVYLGEIPRPITFPQRGGGDLRKIMLPSGTADDTILDDSALAYQSAEGLVIITGCSHAGICNIINKAKAVCGDDRIIDIIGGFHLLDPSPEELTGTCDFLKKERVRAIRPCHCTSLTAKIALASVAPVHEVGVGTVLEYR
jgi:7,8-dihydropterin-6-yl-methyl-4-(beta-D-ribofuranosyl)aminobenzene 5'-phosphate synthase